MISREFYFDGTLYRAVGLTVDTEYGPELKVEIFQGDRPVWKSCEAMGIYGQIEMFKRELIEAVRMNEHDEATMRAYEAENDIPPGDGGLPANEIDIPF